MRGMIIDSQYCLVLELPKMILASIMVAKPKFDCAMRIGTTPEDTTCLGYHLDHLSRRKLLHDECALLLLLLTIILGLTTRGCWSAFPWRKLRL